MSKKFAKIKAHLNIGKKPVPNEQGDTLVPITKQIWRDRFWLTFKYLLLAVVIGTIIRGFLLIPVPVAGNSMRSTLSQGDMVAMEKLTKIRRFDVIVFQQADGSIYIKRVIGLPGESVTYEKDQLYINGKPVEEPFLKKNQIADNSSVPYTTNFTLAELTGSKKLSKGSYFVLGDNRRISKDSRSFGEVDSKTILGKVRLVYYPLNHIKLI